jgi:hypothetical protein
MTNFDDFDLFISCEEYYFNYDPVEEFDEMVKEVYND